MVANLKENEFINDYLKVKNYLLGSINELNRSKIFKGNREWELDLKKEVNDTKKELENKIKNENVSEYIFSDASLKCINEFVEAEMDYFTLGSRGLGRMTSFIPRFGGYFSKNLKILSNEELETIKNTIKDIVKYGYYSGVYIEILNNKHLKTPKASFNNIFEKWIPEIYIANFESNTNLDQFLWSNIHESYLYFCIKIGKETKFPEKYVQLKRYERDKLTLIIGGYIHGGYILRFLEVR